MRARGAPQPPENGALPGTATARRRLDALPLAAGELLALARHLRPRLVPGEEPPAAAVAERIVQMTAEELRELGPRQQERRAAEA